MTLYRICCSACECVFETDGVEVALDPDALCPSCHRELQELTEAFEQCGEPFEDEEDYDHERL